MRWIILSLVLLCTVTAVAQRPFTRDLSPLEAGVGVKVNSLAKDSSGYIWLATDAGLFRFNGRSFVHILDSIRKPVTAVAADGENIVAGFSNGRIGRVENLTLTELPVYNRSASAITALSTYGHHFLLGSSEDGGMFMVVNGVAATLNAAHGLSDDFIYGFTTAGADRILAGSDNGINDIEVINGKAAVTVYTTRNGLPDNIVSVIRKLPDTDLFLIGTQEGGIVAFDAKNRIVRRITDTARWKYGQVNDILCISQYRIWVATEKGYLLEMQAGNGGLFSIHEYSFPAKVFRKLVQDKSGNIWCATNRGLTLMTGEYLEDIRLGLPYSLYDATAMVWDRNMLFIALRKKLVSVSLADSLPKLREEFAAEAPITCLYADKAGGFWVGTMGDGLFHRQGNASFRKVNDVEDIGGNASILSVTGTGSGLWVAGLKGVEEISYPVDDKVKLIKHHGKKTGVGSDYVYQLYPDNKGRIWMATDGAGVCMYDDTNYHHWDTVFGPNRNVAYSITEDVNGDIWAATINKDLYRYHNNRWTNLRLPETQFPDINISAVTANASGQVISVYQRCIDVWYPRSGYFRHFNSTMGLGIDSTSDVLNCIARDTAGNIYAPYQHGIIMFRNQPRQYDIQPHVHISGVTVLSKLVQRGKNKFDHDENYIGFTFDGIGFVNHERLNYRYLLQGYNDQWVYTRDASASFAKLVPGKYTFRVQVSLNPAFEHPNEDIYSFSIAAPFWQTRWFYLTAGSLLLLMVYLYIKLREKRLKSLSNIQQERMVFEYELLKSQVNPHFLFNSLYALSILIEEQKEHAISYTVNLADLYRNMLAHSRKDVILLKDEFEILNNYIEIQQTRFGDALHIQLDVPAEAMETKKIVPLALQLLVENAIKHNVVSVTHPLEIIITATMEDITVRNFIYPKISGEKGAGIGLVNIRQRYSLLTNRPVTYGVSENQFVVKLPLL